MEALFDLCDEAGVADEFAPGDLGDNLAGEVVLCGADAARCNHGIGALHGAGEHLAHAAGVVAHHCLVQQVDPQRGQLLCHPSRVGVDDLAQQQFRAYGDDFCVHFSPRFVVWEWAR